MRNIFLLPTDKPSSLVLETKNNNLFITTTKDFGTKIMKFQHIYITSDEEITGKIGFNIKENKIQFFNSHPKYDESGKKIILTTDPQLIADGVQAIDDDFLEWFVKNPSCESVKVERLDTFKKTNEVYVDEIAGGNYYEIIKQYKIIIPKEEPKQKACDNCNNDVCCCTIKKQETLKEAAERYESTFEEFSQGTESIDFIAGANLQAERMLTDGDLVKLLDFVSKEYNISNGVGWFHSHESIEDVSSKEVLDKWFEQFKKK
jgi:hypothetical protein